MRDHRMSVPDPFAPARTGDVRSGVCVGTGKSCPHARSVTRGVGIWALRVSRGVPDALAPARAGGDRETPIGILLRDS